MRRGVLSRRADFQHRIECALLRGTAGAKGHGKETRSQGCELLPGCAQFLLSLPRLWRKEFKAERALRWRLYWHSRAKAMCRLKILPDASVAVMVRLVRPRLVHP